MPKKVQAQNTILQSTAKPRERVGKPYAMEQFKREVCRAVYGLNLPESTSLPVGLQMIIKLQSSNISLKLVRTSRGWVTEQDTKSNEA